MRVCLAWGLILTACAARTRATPAETIARVRSQVEFDQWPADGGVVYAGFDLLERIPPELEHATLSEDDFDYLSSWQVVTRSVKWRHRSFPMAAVCGVGLGTPDQTRAAFLAMVASVLPAGESLKRDPQSPIPQITAEDPRVLNAFCRGNVFIIFVQPRPVTIDPSPILADWDARLQQQPLLFAGMDRFPRIKEVKPSRPPDQLKKDQKIVFTLKLDGDSGFVPTGIEILESKARQVYRLHTDALHLAIAANKEGSYTLVLWVANRLQLPAIVTQKIVVR